jgi:hypothetical protein
VGNVFYCLGIVTFATGGMLYAGMGIVGGGPAALMAAIYCKICIWLAANWMMAAVTSAVMVDAFVAT